MFTIISFLILITTPLFLILNFPYKIISFLVLGAFILIHNRFNLKVLTIILFAASFLILITSIGWGLNSTKTRVDIEREYASNTKLRKFSGIFSNKYITSFRQSEELFFQNLDFGNYFFAGHPRERLGVREIQKFYAITLVFIILGLIKLKQNLRLFLISFFIFAVSLSVLLKDPDPSGNFLTLPVLVFLTAKGILSLIEGSGILKKVVLTLCILILLMEGIIYVGPI